MYVDLIAGPSLPPKHPPDKGLLESNIILLGGSDGETSDYQRSTPSPRDSETSEDKCEEGVCWKDIGMTVGRRLSTSISPDLGFVDYDLPSQRGFAAAAAKIRQAASEHKNSSLQTNKNAPLPKTQHLLSQNLLNKKLRVQIQKKENLQKSENVHKLPKVVPRFENRKSRQIVIPPSSCDNSRSAVVPNTAAKSSNNSDSNKGKIFVSTKIFYTKPPEEAKSSAETKNLVVQPADNAANNNDCSTSSAASSRSQSPLPTAAIHSASDHIHSDNSITAVLTDSGIATASSSSASSEQAPRPFRFPTLAVADRNGIPCKWDGCGQGFKSHARLSDHIKTVHMLPQMVLDAKDYCCLWQGCKVYGAKSSSASWLQKHVPLHGGKLTFPCIVEGCKNRFSSQLMLNRHVNSHFPDNASNGSGSASKSAKSIEAGKVLKRAGVKLKFRKLPFSARIFDFFDAGIMAGIRHSVADIQRIAADLGIVDGDEMKFESKAMAIRLGESGRREVQIRWLPPNMLPDEWVDLETAPVSKTVKISQLPLPAKIRLQQMLNLRQPDSPGSKQPRKRKQSRSSDVLSTNSAEMSACEPAKKKPAGANLSRAQLAALFL